MGIKHNFNEAVIRLNDEFKMYDDRRLKMIKLTGLELLRRIVGRSPVDTGFYRGSHDLTINSPSSFSPVKSSFSRKGRKSGRGAGQVSDRINEGIVQLDFLKPGDDQTTVVYITNNAPYADVLEEGHSQQAKLGIYNVVASQFESILKSARAAAGVDA